MTMTLTQGLYHYKSYASRFRNNFVLDQSVTYQYSKSLSAVVGHSNFAGLYKANGDSLNFNIVDRRSSSIYGSLTYIF